MLCIGKHMIEVVREQIKRKVALWNEYYPNLKFDKDGRCVISSNEKKDIEEDLNFYLKLYLFNVNISEDFLNAINTYLMKNDYKICMSNNSFCTNFMPKVINDKYYRYDISIFLKSSIKIEYNSNNKYKERKIKLIKTTKFLGEVQNYWLELVPEYNNLVAEIKELRKNGCSPKNNKYLYNLIKNKNVLEEGNLYFVFQKVYNNLNKDKQLYLSINPLDFLTSSGDTAGDIPTKFFTCMSLKFEKNKNYIKIEEDGDYSNPKLQYLLGQVINRGIIFTKNGNILKVPNTDFEFLGYTKRSNVWLDDIGIFSERQYPNKDALEQEFYNCDINIISIEELDNVLHFEGMLDYSKTMLIQDTEKISLFLKEHCFNNYIYLDSVAIINDKITYLPQMRMYYDDIENGVERVCIKCSCCGREISQGKIEMINDEYYCSNCIMENTCEICGKVEFISETRIDGEYMQVCLDCLEKKYIQCNSCGEYIEKIEGVINCQDCLEELDKNKKEVS